MNSVFERSWSETASSCFETFSFLANLVPNKLSARGQFLVEAIVAISVITVGLLGMLVLLSTSIGLQRVIVDSYTGSYLASEGVEVVKAITDENIIQGRPWNAGLASGMYEVEYNSPVLLANLNRQLTFLNGVYSYNNFGAATPFRRVIEITLLSPDEIQVNSRVTWTTRAGGSFNVDAEDRFFNWR